MKHILVEVKTGTIFEYEDDNPEEKKEYIKKSQTEDYMEWFCFNGEIDE